MSIINKMMVLILIKHNDMVGVYLNHKKKELRNINKIKIFLFTGDKNIIDIFKKNKEYEYNSVTTYYLNTLPLYRISFFIKPTNLNHIFSNIDTNTPNNIFLCSKENLNFINKMSS